MLFLLKNVTYISESKLMKFLLKKQRQLEIFHLTPNTTYEFRIWANNKLGAGEKAVITATTVPKTEEKGKNDVTLSISITIIDVIYLIITD